METRMAERSIGDERTQAGGGGPFEEEPQGTRIGGRYEVLSLLGRGGMGVVYRCFDHPLGREVAVKRLLAAGEGSQAGIERFRREGKAVAALNHRNIVIVHELGEDPRGPYMVMELLSGNDMGSVVKEKGALSEQECQEVLRQVGAALSYAHRNRVIHRDIKPSNLYRLADGTVKVVDFGLARKGTESVHSLQGVGMGTPDYVAPEQRVDATHADHRSDLFSLGATLYFLSTGKSPRTVREGDLPPTLRGVVMKLMEERPENRFFSVDDAVAEAARALNAPLAKVVSEKKEGACPGCGMDNPPEARYCEGCGHGLFDNCPSCSFEGRSGRKYCLKCGTNILDFRRAEEHARLAGDAEERRDWRQAAKEWGEALRLRQKWEDAARGLDRARGSEAGIQTLHNRLKKAIQGHGLQAAQDSLRELEVLVPAGDEALEGFRGRTAELSRRKGEANEILLAARKLLDQGLLEEATQKSREAQVAWPGLEEAKEIAARAKEIRKKIEQARQVVHDAIAKREMDLVAEGIRELRTLLPKDSPLVDELERSRKDLEDKRRAADAAADEAEAAYARGLTEDAGIVAAHSIGLWPGHAKATAVAERVRMAGERLARAKSSIRQALERGDIGSAQVAAEEADSLVTRGDGELALLREEVADARSRLEEAGKLIEEGRGALKAGKLGVAEDQARKALGHWDGDPRALGLLKQVTAARADFERTLMSAEVALGAGRRSEARRLLKRAQGIQESDQWLEHLGGILDRADVRARRRLVLWGSITAASLVVLAGLGLWYMAKEKALALETARENAKAALTKAEDALGRGDYEDARTQAKAMQGLGTEQTPDALKLLQRIDRAQRYAALMAESDALFEKGDYVGAQAKAAEGAPLGDASAHAARVAAWNGTLSLQTDPAGADVHLGERAVGKAPLVRFPVPPGTWHLRFTHPDAEPLEREVLVKAKSIVDLETIRLERPAILDLSEVPPAVAVTVNGSPVAGVCRMKPGSATVVFRKDGFRDQAVMLDLHAGVREAPKPTSWVVLPGVFDLSRLPLDVRVRVDGHLVEPGVASLEVEPGAHRVLLERRRFQPMSEVTLTFAPGERKTAPVVEWVPIVPLVVVAVPDLPPPPSPAAEGLRLPEGFVLDEGRIYCKVDGAEMVPVPAGVFTMGDDGSEWKDEKPAHRVSLASFLVDRHEVTVGQYRRFCVKTKAAMPEGQSDDETMPVVRVTWDEASAFAAWAGKRLPTEAEWEKAARGTDGRRYPWGNDAADGTRANFYESATTAPLPAGSLPAGASPYGCFDMAGNVREWCHDWFGTDWYSKSPSKDPGGPSSGEFRVVRGGSWREDRIKILTSHRESKFPEERSAGIGFRTVRSLE
jgi:formylglycine-generating enzyme required for sulfatase activity